MRSVIDRRSPVAGELNYSDEEWTLLARVPETVTAALMVAHSGGIMRESLALLEALDLARQRFSGSDLVQTVLDGIQRGDAPGGEEGMDTPVQPQPPSMESDALALSRRAAALLQKAPGEEAAAYRQFIHFLAEHVAGAAKEGGVFGIGGKRFSDQEMRIIADVDTALRSP
jgi:hypothetical protein